MTTDPLDLWPDAIQVSPLTPLRVLQIQAKRLQEKTQGRLAAEVISSNTSSPVAVPDEWGPTAVHRFEIVAKTLDGYRHQLAVCVHQQNFAYPVLVLSGGAFENGDGDTAASQDEFMRIMKDILNSKQTVGLISSLLARIADADPTPASA